MRYRLQLDLAVCDHCQESHRYGELDIPTLGRLLATGGLPGASVDGDLTLLSRGWEVDQDPQTGDSLHICPQCRTQKHPFPAGWAQDAETPRRPYAWEEAPPKKRE